MPNYGETSMTPLYFSTPGEEKTIIKVNGNPQVKKHLNDLGFSSGSKVTVVKNLSGNAIVKVKESRVAISSEMAMRIMV